MITNDLNNEFRNPQDDTYLDSMTNEFELLQSIYPIGANAFTQTNTFGLVKNAVDSIMHKNNIQTYNIVPTSFAETCDGGSYEVNVAVNYTNNGTLETYVINLITAY